MSRAFESGDKVLVVQNPTDASDRKYAGFTGVVEEFTHRNSNMEVYRVLLEGDDYSILLYDKDLVPYSETHDLQSQLDKAERLVEELKLKLKEKERDATNLPVATVVTYKAAFGIVVLTKQGDNTWLCVTKAGSGDTRTETWDDYNVSQMLIRNSDAFVLKP